MSSVVSNFTSTSFSSFPAICDFSIANTDHDKLFKYLYEGPNENDEDYNKYCRSTSLASLIWMHPDYEANFVKSFVVEFREAKTPTALSGIRLDILAPLLSLLQKNPDQPEVIEIVARVFFTPLVEFVLANLKSSFCKTFREYVSSYSRKILSNLLLSRYEAPS